jgi:MoaA/NifB/PqqE/SkfB family radical SAM enzyme
MSISIDFMSTPEMLRFRENHKISKENREIKGNVMNKEQALRILKMLTSLEVVVFQNNATVPDHVIDELIDVVDMLTDIVLEKQNAPN